MQTAASSKDKEKVQDRPLPILVVEDDPVSRELLLKLLRKAGYEPSSAEDGLAALKLFETGFYPIVITDWMMPQVDGLEFCQALRNRQLEDYVYIILLTARDSKNDIIRGLEAGADDYLVKPVNPAELIARLKTAKRIISLEQSLKKRNEEIAKLSVTDPLTGVYNRRYFNEQLPSEIKRALRYSRNLSLVIGDIDHFKQVNDRYGHRTGDEVLRSFARCLKEQIRSGVDWISRYGGEEFAIVLPEIGLEDACQAAERYRKKVAELEIESPKGKVRITSSFGVACLDPRRNSLPPTMESLIAVADDQLYRAKDAGRNRVSGAYI